jgi:hypothetical protein
MAYNKSDRPRAITIAYSALSVTTAGLFVLALVGSGRVSFQDVALAVAASA